MVSEVFSIPTGLNRLILDVDDPKSRTQRNARSLVGGVHLLKVG